MAAWGGESLESAQKEARCCLGKHWPGWLSHKRILLYLVTVEEKQTQIHGS